MSKQQVIILMDAAGKRIFDSDQAIFTFAGDNGIKDHIEGFAWFGFDVSKIMEYCLFTVCAGFALKCDGHVHLIIKNFDPLRPALRDTSPKSDWGSSDLGEAGWGSSPPE